MFSFLYCRIATGEGWPDIMLACTGKAKCDETLPAVYNSPEKLEYCGNNAAYIYFISFIFLCVFLVSNNSNKIFIGSFSIINEVMFSRCQLLFK